MESAPQRGTIFLVIIGMMIGMVTAYLIIPTEFAGASPRQLSQQVIQQWVRMVAVGHSQDLHYDDANVLIVLQQIPEPQNVVASLMESVSIPTAERAALEALTEISGFSELTGTPAPQDPGIIGSSLPVILAFAVVAIVIPLVTIVGRTIYPTGDRAARAKRREAQAAASSRVQSAPASRTEPQAYTTYNEAPASSPYFDEETEQGSISHAQYGLPVLHAVSTYMKGQEYDDSFAIELGPEQGNQFLGECGISIATRVGNELQSVEFWGFDMAAQETLNKVFAAPAALIDPSLQAVMANRVNDPAVDIVAVEPGTRLILESNSIYIQAEVKSVTCNYGGGTPNSGIERMQIELLAWHKQSQHSAVPASGFAPPADSPFNEYVDMPLSPPAGSASPAPPPAVSGSKPAKRPEDEGEDPFGGTGDFMPYS